MKHVNEPLVCPIIQFDVKLSALFIQFFRFLDSPRIYFAECEHHMEELLHVWQNLKAPVGDDPR